MCKLALGMFYVESLQNCSVCNVLSGLSHSVLTSNSVSVTCLGMSAGYSASAEVETAEFCSNTPVLTDGAMYALDREQHSP